MTPAAELEALLASANTLDAEARSDESDEYEAAASIDVEEDVVVKTASERDVVAVPSRSVKSDMADVAQREQPRAS